MRTIVREEAKVGEDGDEKNERDKQQKQQTTQTNPTHVKKKIITISWNIYYRYILGGE